ncbi:MAG: c-type cytochrome biogenesis protein CcmI [Betaproteobacteria bacterium]
MTPPAPASTSAPEPMAAAVPPTESTALPPLAAPERAGRKLWMVTMAATLAMAVSGYLLTGRPDALDGSPSMAAESAEDRQPQPSPEQIAEMVQRLADRLKDRPEDAEGWTMLSRSYLVLGRLEEAAQASERVLKLKPNDAQALADHADVLAMRAGRVLDGEPMKLIERALKLDPDNLKALALAGAAAFDRGDGNEAARLWDRVALLGPPGSPVVQQAREGAAEARKMAAERGAGNAAPAQGQGQGQGQGQAPAPAQTLPQAPAAPQKAAVAGPTVRGTVTLSAALKAQARPEDTVFIFARNAESGPGAGRMPLAIVRKQVKDLPAAFTLDDSLAMGPGMGLSSAQKVVVGARISRSGQAMPQPGDLEGMSAPVAVGSQGVVVEITKTLP